MLRDPVLHVSTAPLLLWGYLLWGAQLAAMLGWCLCVWPDALLGLCCGCCPGLGAASVTCTRSCVVSCSMLSVVPYLGVPLFLDD